MEKPILFNTAMVQAILQDRKTTTRRIIKPQPSPCNHKEYEGAEWKSEPTEWVHDGDNWYCALCGNGISFANTISKVTGMIAPYQVGDILYVRETWFIGDLLDEAEDIAERGLVLYRANKLRKDIDYESIKWRPSIHMPKKIARIFLKVTNVRVERLQDMQQEDFMKEGIREYTKDNEVFKYAVNEEQYSWRDMPRDPKEPFIKLWDSTLKKDQLDMYGWNANPWVWVIEFERIERGVE